MTSQVKECACPSCGIPLDAASGVSEMQTRNQSPATLPFAFIAALC
jgi:hypothetical protein